MTDVISGQPAPAGADPVSMIGALLDAERVTPDAPEAQPATDAPENNAQVEGDVPDDKAAVAEIPIEQLEAIELEVTHKGDDGKDVTAKLPIKALREGYMRQADYQRKTADLARQREQATEAVRQGVQGERTQYLQNLQQLEAVVMETAAAELKNVNWNDLSINNPFEYVRLQNRQNEVNQTLNNIRTKQQEVRTKQDADTRQAKEQAAHKTWATLETDIPGWSNDLYEAAMKATESVGFNPGESKQWLDAKAIKLAYKAHQYDLLQAGKPAADKKVINVPKVIKPGATATASPTAQKRSDALTRLNKSGKVDDLAAFLSQ